MVEVLSTAPHKDHMTEGTQYNLLMFYSECSQHLHGSDDVYPNVLFLYITPAEGENSLIPTLNDNLQKYQSYLVSFNFFVGAAVENSSFFSAMMT